MTIASTSEFVDEEIGFAGLGWPSVDGEYVIVSGSTDLSDNARTVGLYRRGRRCWRIDFSSDALDCRVADSGRALLSLSSVFVSPVSDSLLVVESDGRRVVEHKLQSSVEILAISPAGEFIAWVLDREIDHGTAEPWKRSEVIVAQVAPWRLCLVRPVEVTKSPDTLTFDPFRKLRVKDVRDHILEFTF